MNERLIAFLQAEELSSARFADIMKIQRSGVSHLLSGRNKPGYDFFEKFLRTFPTVNMEWLISGRGKMYKEQANPIVENQAVVKQPPRQEEPNLFNAQAEETKPPLPSSPFPPSSPTFSPPPPSAVPSFAKSDNKLDRYIEKVIILYNDGTFVST
jgi:transcriptional regulator with XRE-family HTH domain